MINYNFNKLRKWSMNIKVYLVRINGYVALINAAMIVYLTLSTLVSQHIISSITKYAIIVYPVTAILLLIAGYLDVKFGFMAAEQQKVFENVPQMNEIQSKLNNIERMLEDDKKLHNMR